MALQIVDRRLAGKNKSIGNRERFLRRYQTQIREAVRKAMAGRNMRDIRQAQSVTIPRKDISQPVFGHGSGGIRESVHAGNKDYLRGDRIARPNQGGKGGGGKASDVAEGEDDFTFTLTKEEFMEFFFEDLALPNLVRTPLGDSPEWENRRAGFTRDGTPNNLHIVRSMRNALGRRRALGAGMREQLQEKMLALELLKDSGAEPEQRALRLEIALLQARLKRVPFLDPLDLRFRSRVRVPVPTVNAVMFCLMDVSGSMDEDRKRLAKQFFILLYLFLNRHYEKTDVVFIRHHTQATEVDEETFFHATESGGTVVSSALSLMQTVIENRYPPSEWNIYGAQASDGDNFGNDSGRCSELLSQVLLPLCRFYAYVQVAEEEQDLWEAYAALVPGNPNFAMRKVQESADIYPVLHDLFQRRQELV